jgi:hypothetical protein
VTAALYVRSPTCGLVALVYDENTTEQVEYQPAVARRAKVKLTKGCPLEFVFGDGHFASSLSLRRSQAGNSPSVAMPVSTATATMASLSGARSAEPIAL